MPSQPTSTTSGSVTPTAKTPTAPIPTKGTGLAVTPTSTTSGSVTPTAKTPGTGLAVTLTGTASRAAAEGTCLLLTVAGRSYLLVGAVTNIRVGDRITVTGHVDRGVVTTCQAGTPFVVEHVGATDPSAG